MTFLYRFGLTITRRQPYLDWANSSTMARSYRRSWRAIDERFISRPSRRTNQTARVCSRSSGGEIFEEELATWMQDDSTWPAPLTRELFDAWFEVEVTEYGLRFDAGRAVDARGGGAAMDLDYAMSHCAWCEIEVDEGAGRFAAFKLPDRSLYASREGLVLSVVIDKEQVAMGIMTAADSSAALAGEDVVFMMCSSRCEKAIRKTVPRALRKQRT